MGASMIADAAAEKTWLPAGGRFELEDELMIQDSSEAGEAM
jgi:hypothetical protein